MDIFLDNFSFLFLSIHSILQKKRKEAHLFANFRTIFGQFTKIRNLNWIFFVAALLNKLAGPFFLVRIAVIGHKCNFVFSCKCELLKISYFERNRRWHNIENVSWAFWFFLESFSSADRRLLGMVRRTKTINNNLQSLNHNNNYRPSVIQQWYRFCYIIITYYYLMAFIHSEYLDNELCQCSTDNGNKPINTVLKPTHKKYGNSQVIKWWLFHRS